MATAIALALIKGAFDYLDRSKRLSGSRRTRSTDHPDGASEIERQERDDGSNRRV